MKTYYFLTLIALVVMSSCGTAYQTGQTPDAVYYSPESEQPQARAVNNDQYAVATDSDEGNYVVYQDGDEYASDYEEGYDAGYSDGYYSRRIQMFDRPGSLFSYNYNMMSNPWYGGSYYWNRFAWNGFGWYNSPYMWSPGLSFSLSWGRPYYAYGGWYSPWYNPWYSYGHYYNYGYGYSAPGWGWGGKYMNYSPRPAVSYQPRHAAGSRASQTVRSANGIPRTNENTTAPRRVFTRSSSENVQTDNNTRARRTETARTSEHARRVYKPRSDETPVRRVRQSSNTRSRTTTTTQRPTRRVFNTNRTQQVQRQSNTRTQPTRTISRPSSPAPRTSAPRTSAPRRR